MITDLEAFHACWSCEPAERRPNHELGVWPQTRERWEREAADDVRDYTWSWFVGEEALDLDRREFIGVDYGFIPPYESEVLESTEDYEVFRSAKGIVSRGLRRGSMGGVSMSMDQYLKWPVEKPEDFSDVKRRLVAAIPERYPFDVDEKLAGWETREHVLVLGGNCAINGFYWRAREFMGTENLSYAWYDQPALMDELTEFFADFVIETSRPVVKRVAVDYVTLNEDFAMKGGPLLSPATYKRFIFPHLRRMVDFFKSHGVGSFWVDSDGDPSALVPLMMEAGVDTLWPIERAAGVSPQGLRARFGRELHLSGGVDKRVLTEGPDAIREHLREFVPLIEEGGFIPTVDHTVPPDVSWDNFRYYMDAKRALLRGDFHELEP